MSGEAYAQGLAVRTQVMGAEHVARKTVSAFSRPLQDFINEHAWGAVWTRPGLDLKTRSLITIAMLVALGRSEELRGHLRGALNNGASSEEIREVLLHAAVYCGVPAAVEGFRCAENLAAEANDR